LKITLLALVLLAGFSCRKSQARVETGDLLFVGIPMNYGDGDMAQAIADATSSGDSINFIHAAILEVDENDTVWVIDATIAHGVDRHPLDTLFSDLRCTEAVPPPSRSCVSRTTATRLLMSNRPRSFSANPMTTIS
jgi:hypothetical protein